jgi:hypothetical protein
MSEFDTEGWSQDYDACIESGDDDAREWMETNYDAYFNDDNKDED